MKKVLLIITGSVAAFKALELIRSLKKNNIDVTCILTKTAEHFVTNLTLLTLTGNKVYTELFDLENELEMNHIKLSRENDLIVVAPATADFIAKMSFGFADDLASSVILAANKPILIAPAMNQAMWEKKVTQRNIEQIRSDGAVIIEPEIGEMACGEYGMGRLAETDKILEAILVKLGNK